MERFGVKSAPSRNRSKTALYVTPQDRVTEFGSELHEDGGKLFCTSCNVVLNHVRKSAINDHLKSVQINSRCNRAWLFRNTLKSSVRWG